MPEMNNEYVQQLERARAAKIICGCLGGNKNYTPDPTGKNRTWVHDTCGLPSYGVCRECQVCEDLYVPKVYPDYDYLCGDCGG